MAVQVLTTKGPAGTLGAARGTKDSESGAEFSPGLLALTCSGSWQPLGRFSIYTTLRATGSTTGDGAFGEDRLLGPLLMSVKPEAGTLLAAA